MLFRSEKGERESVGEREREREREMDTLWNTLNLLGNSQMLGLCGKVKALCGHGSHASGHRPRGDSGCGFHQSRNCDIPAYTVVLIALTRSDDGP